MEAQLKLNEKLISQLDLVMGRSFAKLEKEVDIKRSTLYRLKDNPANIDMRQLMAIANGLHIPVRHFFYTGGIYTVDKREDYVTEPYLPCRYEYETLRCIIGNRRDITWVKGYEYTGVTEDNLKNSIMKDDAPVNRLLDFCKGFGIDPFTVIIDPNPKEKRKRKRTDGDALLAEMAALHKQVTDLAGKYQALTAKYDDMLRQYASLLSDHQQLIRRFDEHIGESHLGIAAEPGA